MSSRRATLGRALIFEFFERELRATIAGLKNPQTAFTGNSMKPAIHLVTVAALAMLSLATARPARAQQGAVHPPELDMPDATHGKVGITHKSLLKSDVLLEIPGRKSLSGIPSTRHARSIRGTTIRRR